MAQQHNFAKSLRAIQQIWESNIQILSNWWLIIRKQSFLLS